MATETKPSVVKVNNKPSGSGYHVGSSSKPKFDSSLNKKKFVGGGGGGSSSSKQSFESKHKINTSLTKTEVKGKTISTTSKITTKKTTVKTREKREKKVYSLPGQKSDPPEEREPLRIFYESLSKQIPSSEMAEFWMMEHGLLSPERAKKAYEKKQRKQKQLRLGTPIKSPPPPPRPSLPSSRPQSSKPPQQQLSKNGDVKAKKRIIDSDDDDDFVLSHKRRKG